MFNILQIDPLNCKIKHNLLIYFTILPETKNNIINLLFVCDYTYI
jgi:hypothetical protein